MRAVLSAVLFAASAATATPSTSELGPEATGVLVMPGQHEWGTFYEPGFDWSWAGTEQRTVHRFLVDTDTEYAPYFSAANNLENPFKLHVELPRERTSYTVDVAPGAIEKSAARHGVRAPALLVSVDVNDRRGGRGTHFVITKTRVVEDLAAPLARARRAFDALVGAHEASLDKVFRNAERELRDTNANRIVKAAGDSELIVYRPFWNPEAKRVEVFFGYRRVGGLVVKTSSSSGRQGHTKSAPPPATVTARFGVMMAARYQLTADGPKELRVFSPMNSSGRRVPWEDEHGRVSPPPKPTVKHEEFVGACDAEACGPKPRLPTEKCRDGSVGGFTGRCLRRDDGGRCGWEIRRCH